MREYLIGLDTETCNTLYDEKGRLDLSCSLVYDVGWQVTDRKGNIYRQRSFVVEEIFFGMKELVNTCFFADRIPTYNSDIISGKRIVAPLKYIANVLERDMKEFGAKVVFGYNTIFDINALNTTMRYITSSRIRFFFRYDVEFWDVMKMCNIIFNRASYINYCKKNNFMTNHRVPQVRRKAETVYGFINNNSAYTEAHTGLEDVMIETEIMVYCFNRKKKMEKLLFTKN